MLLPLLAAFAQVQGTPADRRLLQPFDYHGVRVTGGLLRSQLDAAREFYLRLPIDDMLHDFRVRAGMPAPGHHLGGTFRVDLIGQIMSALSRMYASTGDPECKAKVDAMLDGWAACIAPDGFFYGADEQPDWSRTYCYDKIVGGLVDAALYAKRPDAFHDLSRITAWAEAHLDRAKVYANAGTTGAEWYTLSENLYRAYLATGDERYRRFAKVWEYTDYWRLYANRQDIFAQHPDGYHAYSHVNTLGSAAAAYRANGDAWYLDAIRNAYDYLQQNECFATGGYGPDERLLPKPALVKLLRQTHASFETQCGTWAVFKLCKNLVTLTGDARYADWTEQVAYNGIGATIPQTADGYVLYYSDYNPSGAAKHNTVGVGAWMCCTGTRPEAIADVADQIYFKAPDGLDVSLFVPSVADFAVNGAKVRVDQRTQFPEAPHTSLALTLDHPAIFAMRFRRPGWLAAPMQARVNGKRMQLREAAGHWMTLRRKWSTGDVIDLDLPMAPRSVPFDPPRPFPTAIAVGPVVLAFRSDSGNPAAKIDYDNLSASLQPVAGDALCYRLAHDSSVIARPFYAYRDGEPYYLYLDAPAE